MDMTRAEVTAAHDIVATYAATARALASLPRPKARRSDLSIEWRHGGGSVLYRVTDEPGDHYTRGRG
jgi:hypothetical protein